MIVLEANCIVPYFMHDVCLLFGDYCPYRGEFGDLYKCQEVTTNREFISKVITTKTAEQKTRAMQEFEMHRQLSHPRVTKLEDAFSNDNQLLLVME